MIKWEYNKIIMFQTPGSKSLQNTLPSTPHYIQQKKQIEYPQVLNIPKYYNLFEKINRNNQKLAMYSQEQKQIHNRSIIKTSIIQKLQRQKKMKGFLTKFNLAKRNAKAILKDPRLGQTDLQKQQKNRKIYFSNFSKVVNLEQECRLLELYLHDQQNKKTKTQYLRNISQTSKNRRINSSRAQSQTAHLYHSQKQYFHSKRMNYQKYDKLFQNALKSAKKNITYRRQQAYQLSLFVINEGFKSLLMSKQIIEDNKKLIEFNNLIRLFIYFAYSSQIQKTYYQYILKEKFPLIIQLLTTINKKITNKIVQNIIQNITKQKPTQVLHFQDFNELIDTLNELTQSNILEQVLFKHPYIFKHKYEIEKQKNKNISEQKKQIQKFINKQKLNVAFKIMFENQSQKFISNKFLSVKYIVDMLKKYSIVPGIVWNQAVVLSCMWVQKRRQGLNLEQFLDSILQMGLSFQKYETFIKYLKQLNLGKLLLG